MLPEWVGVFWCRGLPQGVVDGSMLRAWGSWGLSRFFFSDRFGGFQPTVVAPVLGNFHFEGLKVLRPEPETTS